MHLLLPKSTHTSASDYIALPLDFQIATNDILIPGYQLYAVEKRIVERNRPVSLLVVYTGDPTHTITLTALVPAPRLSQLDALAQWDQAILHLRADGAKPKQTPHGVLMVTSLAHFRSDFTIVHIPDGNFLAVKDQLYTNINLLRMGCSGRSALALDDPSDTTKDRFISMYSLPETTQAQPLPTSSEHLPLPPLIHSQSHSQQLPTRSNSQQVTPARPGRSRNRSTSSLPAKKEHLFGKTKERLTFIATVLELVKLIQAGLAIFGMYDHSHATTPNLDGLLCDITVDGISKWIAKVGGPCVGLEPTERIADPMFVSALLSLILSTRNKLCHLGYSHVFPKDPILHPYAFSLALTSYIQTWQTTSSNYIPLVPTPASILSTAAAAAAHPYPVGVVLTRELVESINHRYDLKIKHESNKVRRAIKNRRTTADSDGGAEEQQQQRDREWMSISGGESARDASPAKVGSSGGQILSGIGSLASGLRLGTGAVVDAGSIVNPTVDLTSFIHGVMGYGGSSIRRVKERKKESVDLVPMSGVGKEKEGVVAGTLKLLWSGRVADIVRIREMDVDLSPSGCGATTGGEHDRGRDMLKRPVHVASDGELDEKGRKTFDGRSTEEESDIPVVSGHSGHSHSFGGMWGGRVRGKLGNWAGLARKRHQSVDLTTPPKVLPAIKLKDPVTPQNQSHLNPFVISGGDSNGVGNGSVSMSREASTASPPCRPGAQSPTLSAMAFSLDGDRYLDDDDILSSGQVSPISDYRPTPFTFNTNSSSKFASTTNLSLPQGLNSPDYEHVLRKILTKNRKRRKKEELGGGSHEEGSGELDSNMGAAGTGKRKEKARFHSLLSVVDWEGIQVEKELDQDSDGEEWEWEWEEGRRKSLFDPRRRRSFHDLETFKGVQVLSLERMVIDVEICGQLLIAWRREEHLGNVAACIKLLTESLSTANKHLREHYEMHQGALSELEARSRVFNELDGENAKVDEAFQATNALRYESEQVLLSELWHTASASRHKVFELRDKVFGTDGRLLPRGMHGAHGKFNRLQWTIDGQKRLVDQVGRTESEAEEERKIVDESDGSEAEEVVEHPGIKPMWLLRIFTSWGARWSADQ